jgi:hypothetical protein
MATLAILFLEEKIDLDFPGFGKGSKSSPEIGF